MKKFKILETDISVQWNEINAKNIEKIGKKQRNILHHLNIINMVNRL